MSPRDVTAENSRKIVAACAAEPRTSLQIADIIGTTADTASRYCRRLVDSGDLERSGRFAFIAAEKAEDPPRVQALRRLLEVERELADLEPRVSELRAERERHLATINTVDSSD